MYQACGIVGPVVRTGCLRDIRIPLLNQGRETGNDYRIYDLGQLLDIHLHAAHLDVGDALLEQLLTHCPEPVECYCDSGSEDKIALLHRFGFHDGGGSQSALRFGTATRDLLILARGSPGS